MEESILNYFPINIQKKIYGQVENFTNLEEIRIRTNKPIILKYTFYEKIIDCIITYKEMIEIVQRICENSIYSYQNQICQGFITVKGGHRVGITGNAVIENGDVININYISSINFRIAREITGCSNKLLRYILNTNENTVYNTLIISPPGAGKTTILRDLVRNINDEANSQTLNTSYSYIEKDGVIMISILVHFNPWPASGSGHFYYYYFYDTKADKILDVIEGLNAFGYSNDDLLKIANEKGRCYFDEGETYTIETLKKDFDFSTGTSYIDIDENKNISLHISSLCI